MSEEEYDVDSGSDGFQKLLWKRIRTLYKYLQQHDGIEKPKLESTMMVLYGWHFKRTRMYLNAMEDVGLVEIRENPLPKDSTVHIVKDCPIELVFK